MHTCVRVRKQPGGSVLSFLRVGPWGRTLSLPGLAASPAEPSHQACFLLVCVLIVHWRRSAMTGFYFVSVAAKRCSQFHAGSAVAMKPSLLPPGVYCKVCYIPVCFAQLWGSVRRRATLSIEPCSLPGYPGVPQLFSHSTWTQCHRFPRNY